MCMDFQQKYERYLIKITKKKRGRKIVLVVLMRVLITVTLKIKKVPYRTSIKLNLRYIKREPLMKLPAITVYYERKPRLCL